MGGLHQTDRRAKKRNETTSLNQLRSPLVFRRASPHLTLRVRIIDSTIPPIDALGSNSFSLVAARGDAAAAAATAAILAAGGLRV